MQRRKFLIGAAGTAVGGSALVGSGAFTSVQANRDVEVAVADDSDAFLAIEKEDGSNADEFVEVDGNGVLGIDITSTDEGGTGVNKEATTIIRDLFKISNQGTQEVYIWVEGSPDGIGFFTDDDAQGTDTGLGVGGQPENYPLGAANPERQLASPGDTLGRCGLYVTDPEALENDETDSITIWAATEDEIVASELGGYNFEDDPRGEL